MPAAPDAQPRKSGSTSLLACTPSLTFWLLLLWIVGLLASVAPGRSSALLPASQLRSLGMILDASAPLSFPEKIVVSPRGNLFLLDTELSNVFLVNKNTREIKALCSPRMPIQPSDISADKIGNTWVINSREKRVAKLDDRCGMQTSFICRNFPIALLVNSQGELVVLTGEGEALFEVYDSAGKLLRSFGQRLRYGDPLVDSELRNKLTRASSQPPNVNLADVPGLSVGETVDLPELSTLDGREVSLKQLKENYMLCAIFTTQCPGCAKDAEMWKDLSVEAAKRQVAFYVISSDDDRSRVERFAKAYGFDDLHVLFDPNRRVVRALKITFVPQYLLMTSSGKVLGRWNGVQNYDAAKHETSRLDYFFQPIASK